MAMTINTNVMSLNAQRNLSTTQSSMSVTMQRLSSGLRVNSAKDDAAGLAIAERMQSQVRGSNVAIRNCNDAISMFQTTEGALGKIQENLQRMRELAVQAANGSYGQDDRQKLQAEVNQLVSEIQKVVKTTQFNGVNILSVSDANVAATTEANDLAGNTSMTFQVGANSQDRTSVDGTQFNLYNRATTGFQSDVNGAAAGDPGYIPTWSTTAGEEPFLFAFGTGADPTLAATTYPPIDVTTAAGASSALDNLSLDIDKISNIRAVAGGLQSRFEATISQLQVYSENTSAARGRIMDADFATETANMSRAQILQQAGTAMVAQANMLPSQVLKLLGN